MHHEVYSLLITSIKIANISNLCKKSHKQLKLAQTKSSHNRDVKKIIHINQNVHINFNQVYHQNKAMETSKLKSWWKPTIYMNTQQSFSKSQGLYNMLEPS